MGDQSSIHWTDATWNPSTGCDEVSPGCKICYAKTYALRLQKMGLEKYSRGFEFTVHRDAFDLPLKWKEPRRIFVDSMSDLFHEDMLFETLEDIYRVMLAAPRHTFQILTKRPERMAEFFHGRRLPPNIWVGTSVEMAMYMPRLDWVRMVDAKVHFVSFEPLLENIPMGPSDLDGIEWAIVGGESGKGHRSFDKTWARNIREACQASHPRVAFFFKQGGGTRPGMDRELDGRLYEEYPEVPDQT